MAARAVVWNPVSDAHERHRLQVYYCSTKRNIAVRQWSPEDAEPWVKAYDEHVESPQGVVKVGGEFAALIWRDWIRAYGIVETKPLDGGASAYYISLLAPVPQSLGIQTKYNRLAGTSHQTADGKDKGWLYYLDKQPTPIIHERALDTSNNGTPVAKTVALMCESTAITDLAACYSVGLQKRFVFFQASDGRIHAYDVQSSAGVGDHNVQGAEAARHGTPLAATSFQVIPEGKDTPVDVIVVYWIHISDEGHIYRSHSSDGGAKWTSKELESIPKPSPETLAVAPNKKLKVNALVFTAENGDTEAFSDEWRDFSL